MNILKKTYAVGLVIACSSILLPAHAHFSGKGMNFSEFDLNGDGKLLEKEFYQARSKKMAKKAEQGFQMKNIKNAPSFDKIDTDGNKEISPKEFSTHQTNHRSKKMHQMHQMQQK